MIALDLFLPYILPFAPGCPEPTAFQAIRNAAQTFCERTRLWRDEDTFEVSTGSAVVAAPSGADLFEIEYATLDDIPLEALGYAELQRRYPDWRTQAGGWWISQVEPDSVLVSGTGTLYLALLLRPSSDADQLPEFLGRHYRREIADGALGELLLLPGQSFTAPERAQFHAARFEARLGALSNRSIKGQQRAPARTRPRFF